MGVSLIWPLNYKNHLIKNKDLSDYLKHNERNCCKKAAKAASLLIAMQRLPHAKGWAGEYGRFVI
jgi:hypothetical protein